MARTWLKNRTYGSTCTSCGVVLTLDNAKQRDPLSIFARCKDCINSGRRGRSEDARERERENERARWRRNYDAAVNMVAEAQGGKRCACCGEDFPMFMSLDHKNNNGGKERGHNRNGNGKFIRRILKGDLGDAQLLCTNCNFAKYRNGGVCPCKAHRRERENASALVWAGDVY